MNNKGFTMIELLATIVIISVITGFATYGVINTIKTSRLKSEKVFVGKLEDAIQSYLSYYGKDLQKKESGLEGKITKCKRTSESSECVNKEVNIRELESINFNKITTQNIRTISKEDIINPKTKQNCLLEDKDPTIRIFKDEDFVYYYYVDLSGDNTSCDITKENSITTNLPQNITSEITGNSDADNNNQPQDNSIFNVELGSYISYIPSKNSYTTDKTYTGYTSNQTIIPQELTLWRVIRINQDNTVDIISEYVSSTRVYFNGITGYRNLVYYLNDVLAQQYRNDYYTVSARYFGYNGQTKQITEASAPQETYFSLTPYWRCSTGGNCNPDETKGGGDNLYITDYNLVNEALETRAANKVGTNTKTTYWMASRNYEYEEDDFYSWYGRVVSFQGTTSFDGFLLEKDGGNLSESSRDFALRPIVTLKSTLKVGGEGTAANPYTLSN